MKTKDLIKNPFIITGLLLRVLLLVYPSQGVMSDYFIPFMDKAVSHITENPWALSPPEYFPYGSILYILLLIPKYIGYVLCSEDALGLNLLSYFLMKVPLLFFDFLMLKKLLRLTGGKLNHLNLFFWLNPVVIYISYIHGQYDLIPMYFAIASILYAGEKNAIKSGLFLALAVLCKFHTIIIAPLLLAYFWNEDFMKVAQRRIFEWIVSFLALFLSGIFPLIAAGRVQYNSVGSPEAYRIFSLSYNFNNQITIYFGVMIVLFLLGRLMLATRMTAEGLFFGSGLLFGSLVVVTHSMPGWYFWILPFFAVFFASYNFIPRSLYFLLTIIYFFAMSSWFHFFSEAGNILNGIAFSVLQLLVIIILVFIYITVISKQAPFVRRLYPLTIGIAGNSGVGKNLISSSLLKIFGEHTTQVIEGDNYHKWERGNSKWQDYTHLHPRANFLFDLKEHFKNLSHGKLIFQRHYDHSSGKFTEPKPLMPTRTLIVQGLHTLYLKSLRSSFDLKIYISPHESIRTAWKIKRDCGERGHTLEKVLQTFKAREKDTELYVQPQKDVADLVIEYLPTQDLDINKILTLEKIDFKMRLVIWNDHSIEELISELEKVNTLATEILYEKDINKISVQFYGTIFSEQIETIATKVIQNQRSVTRSRYQPVWQENYIGLVQLFIVKILSERE